MGRHSSRRQFPYYLSVAGWFLPWLLVTAVAVTAVFVAFDALDGPGPGRAPTVAGGTPASSPTPSEVAAIPSAAPSVKGTRLERKNEPSPTPEPQLITEGITVQVLNGTDSPDAGTLMADRLAQLGYEVYSVDSATSYASTTVLWSYEEARPAAEALANKYGWQVAAKPENLSGAVAMHIVVGTDEL